MPQLEGFEPDALADQLAAQLEAALLQAGISEEQVKADVSIGYEFAKIAGGLLQQEPGFMPEGSDQLIPFRREHCEQVLRLFIAGIEHASIKAQGYKVDGEIKSLLLQSAAQHVFQDAKNIVGTTVGSDLTPDLNLPDDQLSALVIQSAESALLHYMSEYEKEHGPIQEANEQLEAAAQAEQALQEEQVAEELQLPEQPELVEEPEPLSEPNVTAIEPVQPVAPAALVTGVPEPSPLDRLAALGLFIGSLDEKRQAHWLSSFSDEEAVQIARYRDPSLVSQERNIHSVTEQLHDLAQVMKQQRSDVRYQQARLQRQMMRLLKGVPVDEVAALAKDERPRLARYMNDLSRWSTNPGSEPPATTLTQPVQEVLKDYLTLQLSY